MIQMHPIDSSDGCPFLESGAPACSSHFRLGSISKAFDHCIGRYRQCPVYYKLLNRRHQSQVKTYGNVHEDVLVS